MPSSSNTKATSTPWFKLGFYLGDGKDQIAKTVKLFEQIVA